MVHKNEMEKYMNPENRSIRSIFTVMSTAIRTLEKEGRLTMEKSYIQHGSTSVYEHSVKVAYTSLYFARRFRLNIDEKSLIRGALLHDYFLYDWHEKDKSHRLHGFYHPSTALRNAKEDFDLNPIEENMIVRHMFPLTPIPPRYKEAWILCLADKYCATIETLFPLLMWKVLRARMIKALFLS